MKQINIKKILMIMLFSCPLLVHAETADDAFMLPFACVWVAFASLHWSFGFFKPFATLIAEKKGDPSLKTKYFWIMFIIRAVLLLMILPTFPYVFLVDFFALFPCVIVISLVDTVRRIKDYVPKEGETSMNNNTPQIVPTITGTISCPKCGRVMAYGNTRCVVCGTDLQRAKFVCSQCHAENIPTAKFCKSCGAEMIATDATQVGSNAIPKCPQCGVDLIEGAKFCRNCGCDVQKIMAAYDKRPKIPAANQGTPVNLNEYDSSFLYGSESASILAMIRKELAKDPSVKGKTITSIENKKLLFTIFYTIITFILVSLYMFFHTYLGLDLVLWTAATIIYMVASTKLKLENYLKQEVLKRPNEKISYIVASQLASSTTNKGMYIGVKAFLIIACFISILGFYSKPHMIYEKSDKGYVLRYYTLSFTGYDSILEIPAKYKDEYVVGIRGDTFKNMQSLREVILPDTIEEIRGGAFEGCTRLEKVNIPKLVTEIHGSTFKDCEALTTIIIPDGVTRIGGASFQNTGLREVIIPESVKEIGGEAFMGCRDLVSINLPKGITEVHGSTFEDCTSLKSIDIPDGVTRIGGSAFRNCYNLEEAKIPTSVNEIGSSAFRGTALSTVCISKDAMVNERAFKETSASVYYYEDNCTYSSTYSGSYNGYDH